MQMRPKSLNMSLVPFRLVSTISVLEGKKTSVTFCRLFFFLNHGSCVVKQINVDVINICIFFVLSAF